MDSRTDLLGAGIDGAMGGGLSDLVRGNKGVCGGDFYSARTRAERPRDAEGDVRIFLRGVHPVAGVFVFCLLCGWRIDGVHIVHREYPTVGQTVGRDRLAFGQGSEKRYTYRLGITQGRSFGAAIFDVYRYGYQWFCVISRVEMLLCESEFFGEFIDKGFFDGADGDESVDIASEEFAGDADDFVFIDIADEGGHARIFLEGTVSEVSVGIVIGDLADGLSADLITAGGVRFCIFDIFVTEVASENFSKFFMDKLEKFDGVFGINFTVEVPGGIVPAIADVAAHAIDETVFAGLAEDAAAHSAI